jgi:hypothetical protein
MCKTFIEYAELILKDSGKSLVTNEERAGNGKLKLPQEYASLPEESPEWGTYSRKSPEGTEILRSWDNSAAFWNKNKETCRAIYEYIRESDTLRSIMTLALLDFHAGQVLESQKTRALAPYYLSKFRRIADWNVEDYIKARKDGKIAQDFAYPSASIIKMIARSGHYPVQALLMMDEEILIQGGSFEDQLHAEEGDVCLQQIMFQSYVFYRQNPDNICFFDGFLDAKIVKDDQGDIGIMLPSITNSKKGKDRLIACKNGFAPLPIWLSMNASKEELMKDFEAILDEHYIRCKSNYGKSAKYYGKTGNAQTVLGAYSPAKALSALQFWRIKQVIGRPENAGKDTADLFDLRGQNAETYNKSRVYRDAKVAEKLFRDMEASIL